MPSGANTRSPRKATNLRPVTCSTTISASVKPSLQYIDIAPGVCLRRLRLRVSSNSLCTVVSGSNPMKAVVPGSPEEWLRSIRSVMSRNRASAIVNSGRYRTTGASSATLPSSTSSKIATVANILLTEPMLKRVFGSTARFCARSATPIASDKTNSPRSMIATDTPLPWPELIAFQADSRAPEIAAVLLEAGSTGAAVSRALEP